MKKGPADLKQPPWDQKGLNAKKQAPPEVSMHGFMSACAILP